MSSRTRLLFTYKTTERGSSIMQTLRDTAFGARLLRRSPGFAIAALLSLVLGIGINTAVYTLWDAIFLRPLPVEDLESLQIVHSTRRNEGGEFKGLYGWAWPDYLDLRDRNRTLADLSLHQWAPMNFSGGSEPQRATGVFATANYFQVLGLEPAHGRFFTASEDAKIGAHPVVVLSHAAWGRLFGNAQEVLGKIVRVNGREMTIIGVSPKGFRAPRSTPASISGCPWPCIRWWAPTPNGLRSAALPCSALLAAFIPVPIPNKRRTI
jgi:hypothetical protein